jgi:hypothetical protein
MRNRVLFVTEKFVDGIPSAGLTNNFHNLFNTFQQSKPDYQFNTLHIDESSVVYGKHIDEVLPQYCLHWDVNIVFFCLLGDSPMNPTKATFEKLKGLGITLVFVWPDTGQGWACDTMYGLGNLADLHVTWDRPVSAFHQYLKPLDNCLPLWAPQDEHLYKWKSMDFRPIKIGFYGRPFLQRAADLAYLSREIPEFRHGGGQREQRLSPELYARQIQDTEIVVNFPTHALGFTQLKSRVLEVMACNTLLFELKNASTSQLFEPNKDYVECESIQDVVEKYKYFSNNRVELGRIAHNGNVKYQQFYTAQRYWDKIFERIKV